MASARALPIPAPNLGEGIPLPIFKFGAGILSPNQIFSKLHLVRGFYTKIGLDIWGA